MLEKPIELLEIPDGETRELRIVEGRMDQAVIKPDRAPGGVVVDCLRVWTVEGTKEHHPPYWDITAARLYSQLIPHLSRPDLKDKTFVVTAHGAAPNKYFSLEVK